MTNTLKVIAGIVVVWLVALTGLSVASHGTASSGATKLGAQVQQETYWFVPGAQFGPTGTTVNWSGLLPIASGANQVSWKNTTGSVVFVSTETARAYLTGTSTLSVWPGSNASTTLALWAGTSTTATVTDSQTIPIYGSIFDKVLIATTTPINTAHDGVVNSAFAGANEQGLVAVQPNQYVVFVLEDPYNQVGLPGRNENATSTNRGYNLVVDFPYQTL